MRFYRLELTNPDTGEAIQPASLGGMAMTSLLPSGQFNPAALNIELDIPQSPMHVPTGSAYVRIWGLGIAAISSSFDLRNAAIKVYGGMSAGLPLANSKQSGLLVTGQVIQAFGNWIGTDQTLDLILAPPAGNYVEPLNFVLNWQANQPLADALKTTFSTALPSAKQDINISPRLVLNHDEVGYYETLTQFAQYLQPLTQAIVTETGYAGVNVIYDGVTIKATDFTAKAKAPMAIAPQDLIGQPTWIAGNVISVKTVMRGDIDVGDLVTIPPTLFTNATAGYTSFFSSDRNKLTFSGTFQVTAIHHYGNFRQPDAASWNTTFEMVISP